MLIGQEEMDDQEEESNNTNDNQSPNIEDNNNNQAASSNVPSLKDLSCSHFCSTIHSFTHLLHLWNEGKVPSDLLEDIVVKNLVHAEWIGILRYVSSCSSSIFSLYFIIKQ